MNYLGEFPGEIEGVQGHQQQLYVCSTHSLSDSDVFAPPLIDVERDFAPWDFPVMTESLSSLTRASNPGKVSPVSVSSAAVMLLCKIKNISIVNIKCTRYI